jgi:hypothetical protein
MIDTDYANSIKRRRLPPNGLMDLLFRQWLGMCDLCCGHRFGRLLDWHSCFWLSITPSRKEYDRHRLRQLHKEKKAASQRADGTRDAKPKATFRGERFGTVAKLHPGV